ncbi:MAG: hypothetical protein ACSHXI_02265 [Hoeflea sp.]|uniref:hypothetical protein n=1 Tax=Hoeflea sp. TaxID=1940281 RepID=UPI003EF7BC76
MSETGEDAIPFRISRAHGHIPHRDIHGYRPKPTSLLMATKGSERSNTDICDQVV